MAKIGITPGPVQIDVGGTSSEVVTYTITKDDFTQSTDKVGTLTVKWGSGENYLTIKFLVCVYAPYNSDPKLVCGGNSVSVSDNVVTVGLIKRQGTDIKINFTVTAAAGTMLDLLKTEPSAIDYMNYISE